VRVYTCANATQIARLENDMRREDAPGETAGQNALSGQPEPWEPWETKLVLGSIAVGAVGLVLLGWLVDRFILP
jgi:hypothetical protein